MNLLAAVSVSLAASFTWLKVTPETMLRDVPEFSWVGIPGSVQSADWRLAKPVESCPVYNEEGRIVGASIGCGVSK